MSVTGVIVARGHCDSEDGSKSAGYLANVKKENNKLGTVCVLVHHRYTFVQDFPWFDSN